MTGFSETEGMYMYMALNRIGSGTYHGTSSILVPFSQRTYGVIGGERERESRAPGVLGVFSFMGCLEDAFSEGVQA